MTIFAQVVDGVLWETLETDLPFEWPDFQTWIDITDFNPLPKQGWLWDGTYFTEPPPPYIDPRPELYAKLDRIDKASTGLIRALIIANPEIGAGTSERSALEDLEVEAEATRQEIADVDAQA